MIGSTKPCVGEVVEVCPTATHDVVLVQTTPLSKPVPETTTAGPATPATTRTTAP